MLLSACAPKPSSTSTPSADFYQVSTQSGLTYTKPGAYSILIPANAVARNTQIRLSPVPHPSNPPKDSQPISNAFEINLSSAGSLRTSIDLGLNLTTSLPLDKLDRAFLAYFKPDEGWVALSSYISEADHMTHARVNHFSIFQTFLAENSLPRFASLQAEPVVYDGVGWPPCFKDNLYITASVQDPHLEIAAVKARIRIFSYGSELLTLQNQFIQSLYGAGLVFTAGGVAGIMPAGQTALTLATTHDPGIVESPWYSLASHPANRATYGGYLNLSRLSTCEGYFSTLSTMSGVGIQKIVVDVAAQDSNAKTIAEDQVEIPVMTSLLNSATPIEPGPGLEDVRPNPVQFRWNINIKSTQTYYQRLVYAKGETLWNHLWKSAIKLDYNITTYTLSTKLSPGQYVWGIEVSSNPSFPADATIRSSVFRFTVPDLWFDAWTEGELVWRSDSNIDLKNRMLRWNVSRDGQDFTYPDAADSRVLDLRSSLAALPEGTYTIYLETLQNGDLVRASNVMKLVIKPKTAPTSTLTPTGTPTRTSTRTSTPTPTASPSRVASKTSTRSLTSTRTRTPTTISQPAMIKVTKADNGKTVSMKTGDILEVTLTSPGGTGAEWMVTSVNANILKQLGPPSTSTSSNMPGAPLTWVFKFQAISTGQTSLQMQFKQSWQGGSTYDSFQLIVSVK